VDFFSVGIDVVMDNCAHMNLLDAPPDDIAQSQEGDALQFVYEGPLARAQRNQELINIQQSVADIGGIIQFSPETVKLVDWEKLARRVFEIRGTNDLLFDNKEYTDAVNELTQQKNAEKMAGLVGGGAEALGKVAPFLKVARDSATGGEGGQAAA